MEKLKLPLADGFVISDGSGLKGRRADRARIEAITLGSLSFNQLTATVLGEGPPHSLRRSMSSTSFVLNLTAICVLVRSRSADRRCFSATLFWRLMSDAV